MEIDIRTSKIKKKGDYSNTLNWLSKAWRTIDPTTGLPKSLVGKGQDNEYIDRFILDENEIYRKRKNS